LGYFGAMFIWTVVSQGPTKCDAERNWSTHDCIRSKIEEKTRLQ